MAGTSTTQDPKTSSVGSRVWFDTDGDGQRGGTELGAAGVLVTLKTFLGATVATTTTDSNGSYLFTGLAAGQYQVQFVNKTGYNFTGQDTTADDKDSDANTTTGLSQLVTLGINEQNRTVDAGVVPIDPKTSSLGDYVWVDTNGDGIQNETATGLAGVTVNLKNAAGTTLATQTTAADGSYLFTGLAAGQYQVQFVNKTGYTFTGQDTTADDKDSDANTTTGLSQLVKSGAASGIFKSTTTDGTGHYLFTDLPEGDYQIRFYGMAMTGHYTLGYVPRYAGGDTSRDSNADSNGTTEVFHLNAGQHRRDIDAGFFNYTPIALDLDGNGIQTTTLVDSQGKFDLLGNGTPVHSGWLSKGDGFLAVDTNGNGKIDAIHELFGGEKKGEGFAKLATYDTNHDGWVDAKDAGYKSLLVWQDLNGDHQSTADELRSLADVGIASLKVANTWDGTVQNGNTLGETSSATRADGSSVAMVDVYFATMTIGEHPAPAASAPVAPAQANTLANLLQPSDELLHKAMLPSEATAAPETVDGGEALRQLLAAWNSHSGFAMQAV